jgi:hypothetical protein
VAQNNKEYGVNVTSITVVASINSTRMSERKYAPPQLKIMRDKIRELEERGLVYKNTRAE